MVTTASGQQIKSHRLAHRYASAGIAVARLWAAVVLAMLAGKAVAADKPVAVDHAAKSAEDYLEDGVETAFLYSLYQYSLFTLFQGGSRWNSKQDGRSTKRCFIRCSLTV